MLFLPIVMALFWFLPAKFRTGVLVIASYVFYMWWKPVYGLLLLAMTVVSYFFGLKIAKADEKQKRNLLILSVVSNLALLGYFKYAGFAMTSLQEIFNASGVHQTLPVLNILLPLGISFFTFEFIHYVVDVYKGAAPVTNFLEFTLFASFFPSQIAGPIKRFQDFIPQLKAPKIDIHIVNEAIELTLFGLFKKVVLADSLAVVVNRCYSSYDMLNGTDMWLANAAFAFQIYFDFSGYTDIARGSALLLGVRVPVNFDLPYMSGNITEFWRRWHITLGSWLREYLYIPLGGSRFGELFTLRNLLITMTVCGLWHGAASHFVVWGVFQGVLLLVHRLWADFKSKNESLNALSKTGAYTAVAIVTTFIAVEIGWVLFRSDKMPIAMDILQKMFYLKAPITATSWYPTILTTSDSTIFQLLPLILGLLVAAQIGCDRLRSTPGIMPNFPRFPAFKPAYLAALILLLLVLSPDVAPSFIYFQF